MHFAFANDIKLVRAAENHWRARLLLREITTTWRNGLTEPTMRLNQGKCQVLYLRQAGPMQQYRLGATQLERSLAKKNPRVDTFDTCPQCALAATKTCSGYTGMYRADCAGGAQD